MILVLNEKDHINSVFPKLNVVRMKNTKFCEKAELVGDFPSLRCIDTGIIVYDLLSFVLYACREHKLFSNLLFDVLEVFP
jgi:hypothetical protein